MKNFKAIEDRSHVFDHIGHGLELGLAPKIAYCPRVLKHHPELERLSRWLRRCREIGTDLMFPRSTGKLGTLLRPSSFH